MHTPSSFVQQQHVLFEVEGQSYLGLHTMKLSNILNSKHDSFLTIIPPAPHEAHKEWIQSFIDLGLQQGDLKTDFLAATLYLGDSEISHHEQDLNIPSFSVLNPFWLLVLSSDRAAEKLRELKPGPYAFKDGNLWHLSRICDDTQGAFLVAVMPRVDNNQVPYLPLGMLGGKDQNLAVAIPPRLQASPDQPLGGMRFVVKDMFHVYGLTMTLCNKAYYAINKPSDSTAACIQRLVDLGANLVATTKLSSMVSREEPTEAVNYQSPLNPRADGYQSPAGSSSGSAAAVAAYDWLDFAVGEDTSGSGRRPAAANGCFQFRPTHDLVDCDGMLMTFEPFDTPVIHTRDLNKLELVASVWVKGFSTHHIEEKRRKTVLLYPQDFLGTQTSDHLAQLEGFVSDLERTTNSCVSRISLEDLWQTSTPPEANNEGIQDYLNDVIVTTYYRAFYDSQAWFRDTYFEKHNKTPYVNEFVKWRWGLGKSVTDLQHQEGLKRLSVYRSWLLDKVMSQTDVDAVLILPISEGTPNYRDKPPREPSIQSGFDPLYISPILQAPDIVLPIGQVAYNSRVSGQQEMLPICVSLVGTPGNDAKLINLARTVLETSGRPISVKTGPTMF